ncbi:DUF6498-containing protein [Roseibacillus ishigakijimensis]|uniref:Uncharacterized protein n=2 Tax=Roseibacillus ishigakijimensis TaxID=454146 RepID=A0A934VL04_9BACT|nr:hypothetical protein [Roseibacillus ishigakijimensis]
MAAVAPLAGVLLWGWSAREIVLLYWWENVLIGFWQLLKMLTVGAWQAREGGCAVWPATLFVMAFFAVHYGGFCGGHGLFVLELTGRGEGGSVLSTFQPNMMLGPLVFVQLFALVLQNAWLALPAASFWSVASLFAMRGLAFVQDFVLTGEFKKVEVQKLMMEPYKNVIALHVAIIFGAGLTMAFEGAWPLLALIVLGKLVMDVGQIRKEGLAQDHEPGESSRS